MDGYSDGFYGEYVYGDRYTPEGYEGELWKYSTLPNVMVSDMGRFYNVKSQKFITPTHGDREGHKAIKTHYQGQPLQEYAHRLIAEAFVPNPKNLPIVRHLNDDPDDNELCNLAWGTQRDNISDSFKNGHREDYFSKEARQKSIEACRIPVKAINHITGEELHFSSLNDAVRYCGVQQANAWKVLYGKRPHTCGWIFIKEAKND